ncbi:hypothetical protein QFZ37_003122 [Chryseobacterium ginsenosidimutans]|uniref:hypothetical protein n=1 Tax=Chryseobacterium ginsenosidimutans TaxID=687846 RepID=UPI0027887F1A|nr:hypothetical protein [Chryseobacterium ginsenosidimutans]MDQ0594753.1 hypothetical protein [Chryseobacterium ginsenosidimutans]
MVRKEFLSILEWSFVMFIALNMSIYGGAKFLQFGEISHYKKPLSEYKGMDIMWAFYSYSGSYAIILGLFEIIGSVLLILPKTRIIGCFVLSGILFNVILQDYFYDVSREAMANAILYQLLIFGILWANKEKLILMITAISIDFIFPKRKKLLLYILLIVGLFVVLTFCQSAINFLLNILKI